jgi:hypothetical protein
VFRSTLRDVLFFCAPLIVLLIAHGRARTTAPRILLHVGDLPSLPSSRCGHAGTGSTACQSFQSSIQNPGPRLFPLDKPHRPLLPSQSRFYQIADIAMPIMPDGEFDRRIRATLNNPLPGGAWELHTRGKPIRKPLLERYGLRVDASRPCVEIEGAQLATAIEACPLIAREK